MASPLELTRPPFASPPRYTQVRNIKAAAVIGYAYRHAKRHLRQYGDYVLPQDRPILHPIISSLQLLGARIRPSEFDDLRSNVSRAPPQVTDFLQLLVPLTNRRHREDVWDQPPPEACFVEWPTPIFLNKLIAVTATPTKLTYKEKTVFGLRAAPYDSGRPYVFERKQPKSVKLRNQSTQTRPFSGAASTTGVERVRASRPTLRTCLEHSVLKARDSDESSSSSTTTPSSSRPFGARSSVSASSSRSSSPGRASTSTETSYANLDLESDLKRHIADLGDRFWRLHRQIKELREWNEKREADIQFLATRPPVRLKRYSFKHQQRQQQRATQTDPTSEDVGWRNMAHGFREYLHDNHLMRQYLEFTLGSDYVRSFDCA